MNYGELIDRYTINYLKYCNKNKKELEFNKVLILIEDLLNLNKKLWDLEDKIRGDISLEKAGKLGKLIAVTNDDRCEIKNKLNSLIGSNKKDEKHYKKEK